MKYNVLKLSAVLVLLMNPARAAFHKDALVSTSDGILPMNRLEVGQQVHSFSVKNGTMDTAMVMGKSLADQVDSIMEIELCKKDGKRTIRAMPNQQLFDVDSQDWVRAKDLTPDHILLGEDGSEITIVKVQKQRRSSFSLPYEVSVAKGHNLFVDRVLCHNMDFVEGVAKFAIQEGVKKTLAPAVAGPMSIAVGGTLMIASHAARQINQRGHEIVQESFCDYDQNDLPPALRDAGIEIQAPAVVEVRPGGAPQPPGDTAAKRRANQEKLERFRQANQARRPCVHVVNPGISAGPRAVIQIPQMFAPQPQFAGMGAKMDMRTTEQVRADAKREYKESEKRHKEWIAQQEKQKCESISKQADAILLAEKEKKQQAAQRAADKRAADKEQMEGRAAAIQAAGAKTAEERRAAIKSYDERVESFASAPASVIPKATPQEVEALNKIFSIQDKAPEIPNATPQEEEKVASMFKFALGYKQVHPEEAAAPRSFSLNQEILALPPKIGIHVLTKAGYEAQNRVLSRMRAKHEEDKRQLEEQQRIERQEGIEAAKRSEGAHKRRSAENARAFHQDIKKEHELLKERIHAQTQAKHKK